MVARALPAPLDWPRLATAPLLVAVGAILLVLRRPESFVRPQFVWEDAAVFYVPTYFSGPELIVTPYAGYLNVVPRLGSYAERLVPPAGAPVVGTLIAFGVVLAVAAFIAFRTTLPGRRVAAVALLLAPGVMDMHGSLLNVNTYLAIYLVALSTVNPTRFDWIGSALASLSGPFAILLAPLYLRHPLKWVVWPCAALQFAVIVANPSRGFGLPGNLGEIVLGRVNIAVLGPVLGWVVPLGIAAAVIAVLLVVAVRVPWRVWTPYVYAAVVIAGAGILVTGAAVADDPRNAERYFLPAFLAVVIVVVAGIMSRDRIARPLAWALAVPLAFSMLFGFRLPPYPDTDWSTESRCIGSPHPCMMTMYPAEWSVRWPGSDGDYEAPLLPG